MYRKREQIFSSDTRREHEIYEFKIKPGNVLRYYLFCYLFSTVVLTNIVTYLKSHGRISFKGFSCYMKF
jgi:hypothetical protein